ncbi:MAG: phosphate propanoyltransferase [Christensenellaceae bacterium]|jgi:hypothetical protein|nr:phosphate propanoyltransferase [Clostridia bacterium]PWM02902.1 MAG: phosphate propanoyltransferase [Clostridiales bacterium]
MEISSAKIAEMVKKVLADMEGGANASAGQDGLVPVGVSNRHIHLTKADLAVLFGEGYELTPLKDLSQPGQFACKETLTLVGPSLRPIENVRVLGPLRGKSQVEISATDSYVLKVKPPVRESGNVVGSAGVTIVGPKGVVQLKEGCIIANRHIHMSPSDAASFRVKDGDTVTVDVEGKRRTRWYDVQVRVSPDFRLEMHVDTDDANAAGIGNGFKVKVVRE